MTTGSPIPATKDRPPPRRSATPKIAGVAGGLSDASGIDPSIIRIGFALLALASGAGLVIYLGAWLLMLPAEHGRDSVTERPTPALIFGGVLLGAGLLVGLMTLGGFAVLPAVIIGLVFGGIVLLNRTSDSAKSMLDNGALPLQPSPPNQAPPGQAPPNQAPPGQPLAVPPPPGMPLAPPPISAPVPIPAPFPPQPTVEAEPPETDQLASWPPPNQADKNPEEGDQGEPEPAPYPDDITEVYLERDIRELRSQLAEADFGDLGPTQATGPTPMQTPPNLPSGTEPFVGPTVDLQDDVIGNQARAHWALARTEAETTIATARPDEKPGPPLATITLAALAMLTGIGLVFNTLIGESVSAVTLAGVGTSIVGLAVVFSAFNGRTRRLVPIAIGSLIVLLASPFVEFAARDGIGGSLIRVASLQTLEDEYAVGIGYLDLRLDDLTIEEDTEIDVDVGIGSLHITVPADAVVEIRASTQIGYIYLLDRERSGIDQTFTRIPGGRGSSDEPRLIINAENTIGEIQVFRAREN